MSAEGRKRSPGAEGAGGCGSRPGGLLENLSQSQRKLSCEESSPPHPSHHHHHYCITGRGSPSGRDLLHNYLRRYSDSVLNKSLADGIIGGADEFCKQEPLGKYRCTLTLRVKAPISPQTCGIKAFWVWFSFFFSPACCHLIT